MQNFKNLAMNFLKSEDGPTATEYAVMLALIIIVALGAITGLGTTATHMDDIYVAVNTKVLAGTAS